MEQIKVFELAKQMGMETIALMDKLREFKIPVKSHMAELDEILVAQIQVKFDEEKKTTPKKATKTVRAKKAASSASPAISSNIIKSNSTAAKAPVKATSKPAVKAVTKASGPVESALPSSRTVIRRKANAPELVQPDAVEIAEQNIEGDAQHADSVEGLEHGRTDVETSSQLVVDEKTPVRPGMAQVISRIDLRDTMGSKAPVIPSTQGTTQASKEKAVADARAASEATLEANKFDREAIGKLIKQEALAQAKKAAALLRETKIETFNAADFKKREMLFQPKKKKTLTGRAAQKTQITKPGAAKRKIKIDGLINVSELAQAMGIKANVLLKKLLAMGSTVAITDVLDFETAQITATEFGFEVENINRTDEQLIAENSDVVDKTMQSRPPVVTVMGHVDHGKTSLLDSIRKANVASGEAGGITQHIGAYSVEINSKKITFLDTPGHEAFTAMRARGAKVTDIVILVVAADDGIMPQTREAILHAKTAGVPIIVVVNKMDLPAANPQKVLQGLTEFELVPEEWGGTTIVAKVSATKKDGIKELLEMILLQAEVLELKANPNRPASGTIIEARLERGCGTVATMLVQQGTARIGDIVVAGVVSGRIRAMNDDKGKSVKQASPGDPVEITGLDAVPSAGDVFDVVKSEEVAKEIIEKRISKTKASQATPALKMSLEDLFAKVQQSDVKELAVIVKADVHGSAEALKELLNKSSSEKVRLKVLSSTVGGITESDVLLASTSNAIIIGFNVRPESGVGAVAEREGIEIKTYSIIYEVIDDIKKAMTGMLAPTFVEKALGRAEVRSLFNVPKVGTVAGCMVVDGKVTRQSQVRLLRDSRIIYEGKLASLRRFKDDAREVQSGYECGIGIDNYNDLKVGDVIEAYTKEQVASLLS